MAEEAKKANAQFEQCDRKLVEKSKECQTLKSEMTTLREQVLSAEKQTSMLTGEKEELEKRITLLRESTQSSSDEVIMASLLHPFVFYHHPNI
jgi:predicted  nucleic acid-binding Zn-ribbon protein